MTDGVKDAKENFEAAIVAGKDISRVLDLDPPVNTVFESNAKGGGLTKARAKFADSVDAEIIDLCQATDPETGQYLMVLADISNFETATQEYLKTVLPDEVRDRLFSPVDEKSEKKVKTPKVSALKKKGRLESLAEVMKEMGVVAADKDQVIAEANKRYVESGGKDNVKESSWAYGTAINVLTGYGIIS